MSINWRYLLIGLGISLILWARALSNSTVKQYYTPGFVVTFLVLTSIITAATYLTCWLLFDALKSNGKN